MLWKVGSAVPLSGRILAFSSLSLGMGLVSQTAPKLQIPFEYVNSSGTIGRRPSKSGSGGDGASVSNGTGGGDEHVQGQVTTTSIDNTGNNKNKARWKVRCPFDFTDARSQCLNDPEEGGGSISKEMHVYGIDRITRHPGLWGFGIVGMGLSFLTPSVPTRIWLCMPVMVALIGGEHTDSRHRRGMGGTLSKDLDDKTSNIPFWAMVSGKQGHVMQSFGKFLGEEVKVLNGLLVVGLAASIVVRKGRGSATVVQNNGGGGGMWKALGK
jgi:hypothetical protein